MSGWRRPRPPVIPGQICPAGRTARHHDPKVQIERVDGGKRYGLRKCGRCGREGVPVQQWHDDAVWTAWQYDQHRVPERTTS